jgi:hypothetical protein
MTSTATLAIQVPVLTILGGNDVPTCGPGSDPSSIKIQSIKLVEAATKRHTITNQRYCDEATCVNGCNSVISTTSPRLVGAEVSTTEAGSSDCPLAAAAAAVARSATMAKQVAMN